MNPMSALIFCAALGGLTAGVAVLSELNHATGSSLSWVMISRFVVVTTFAGVGVYAASQSRLRASVVMEKPPRRSVLRELTIYGLAPGLALGLINDLFFFRYRYSPLVTPRIREMESVWDSLLVSLDTGIVEEVIYRLFILSCLLFLFQHLYRKIQPMWPVLVAVLPRAMALVVSSLLFAAAHSVSGFTGAFSGGMVLGFIYMKSGVESAMAAHIVANFLFFSASYLMS